MWTWLVGVFLNKPGSNDSSQMACVTQLSHNGFSKGSGHHICCYFNVRNTKALAFDSASKKKKGKFFLYHPSLAYHYFTLYFHSRLLGPTYSPTLVTDV
jgi:hypothetical protein